MKSLRSHEGYFLIDHRDSPGVSDEVMVAQGMPPGSGHHIFESATFTCSHCQAVVVMHPDRSRDRGYCRKCDHLICDGCETAKAVSGGECRSFKRLVDNILNDIAKGGEVFQSPTIII
mgnify:FL=1